MRTLFATALMAALTLTPCLAGAQIEHGPVYGDIQLSVAQIECPVANCMLCVNDVDDPGDHRLMLAFGATTAAQGAWGTVIGTVAPFVEIDGVTLTPDLLPAAAYFSSVFYWRDFPFPPVCANGSPPQVIYQIADRPQQIVSGDGTETIVIPVRDALVVPFEVSFCSQFVSWGAGCDVAGSSERKWRLFLPAPVQAFTIVPGDAPPVEIPDMGIMIDVADGPGGTLSASRIEGAAPFGTPPPGPDGYWDLSTDAPAGSFEAEVAVAFDPATLPDGVSADDLRLVRWSADDGIWQGLATSIDAPSGTATASVVSFGPLALTWESPLAVEAASWGKVKAVYRAR
jgi:hypothetical protein